MAIIPSHVSLFAVVGRQQNEAFFRSAPLELADVVALHTMEEGYRGGIHGGNHRELMLAWNFPDQSNHRPLVPGPRQHEKERATFSFAGFVNSGQSCLPGFRTIKKAIDGERKIAAVERLCEIARE